MVQEIFLKAYRGYDSYRETGAIRTWLKQIARRTLYSYHSALSRTPALLILDAGIDCEDGEEADGSLYDLIPNESSPAPEEALLQKELTARMLTLLRNLPQEQRTVLEYRFFGDLSVKETAARMKIPVGSVKSSTFYGLKKLRQGLEIPSAKENFNTSKGEFMMNCEEAQIYLFQYAADKLPEDRKTTVKAHLKGCPLCRNAATALEKLIPHLPEGKPDEFIHFNIAIPDIHLSFNLIITHVEKSDCLNKILAENGGKIPEGINWQLDFGSTRAFTAQAFFDNEGHSLEFQTVENSATNIRNRICKLVKIYDPLFRVCMVMQDEFDYYAPQKAKEAPNLYTGKVSNALESSALEGLYVAIPKDASNVRIQRGNGVIDCETYQFVYSCRYVENETHRLEYSYNKD